MAAGVAYVVDVLLALLMPETATSVVHLFVDRFPVLPVLLTLVGMVGLHTLQKANYGGTGRGGFWTVVVGLFAQAVGRIAHVSGSEALDWLVFPVGIFIMIVGLMLYGAATLQARVLPRWCGIGFIVFPPLTIVLEMLLGLVVGAAVVGGGLRALVAKKYGSRAALMRAVGQRTSEKYSTGEVRRIQLPGTSVNRSSPDSSPIHRHLLPCRSVS
jgi:hypothetical protein